MSQASGEASILHEKHLMYFLSLAEQGYAAIHGPDAFPWIHRLEREIDNFRSALEWSVTERNYESALRLLVRLSSAWGWEGHFLETCSWFERICSLTTIHDYPEPHASLLNHLGWENWLRGNLRYAQSVLQEGREIWLQLGPRGEQGLAQALDGLGIVTLYVDGDKERTRSFFEQSLELFRKHDDVWGMSKVTFNLGNLAEVQGRFEEAEDLYRNSLAAFRELGDQYMVAFVYSGLGDLARVREDYEWAEKYHEQTLEIFQQQRGRVTLAWPYINLGWVSIRRTNYRKARNLLEESLQLAIELDNKGLIGGCLAGFASILAMTGKPEQAARLFGTADSLSESLGPLEPADQKDQDYYTGLVRGQLDQAVFEKAWNEGRAMSLDEAIAYALAESK